MSASDHEFGIIDVVRRAAGHDARVPLGIGDDAAALQLTVGARCLVTTDLLLEGVHFETPAATPEQVGRKALAVNLSDIAAMAGKPVAAFVSVAFARDRGREFAERVMRGLQSLADEFDVAIAGGDTNVWPGPTMISVTIVGESSAGPPVTRAGARAGDWIMVTGCFGNSPAGHHLSFRPRVKEALQLRELADLHSMIDVSDGLAADLHHILDESDSGAIVEVSEVPIRETDVAGDDDQSPLDHALSDGEDFELLFTVSEQDGRRLPDMICDGVPVQRIGEIVGDDRRELVYPDGSVTDLPRTGWEHRF